MKKYIILLLAMLQFSFTAGDSLNTPLNKPLKTERSSIVYQFTINQDIMPSAWRLTKRAFDQAEKMNADYILIRLNTYGGMVPIADSIRTRLINSKIPVLVFIDNNAASAGALISIAADSIYMRKGGSIGAATVVNQSGEVMPDKYQSYMRSTMRSTAESHGKDTLITGNDTIFLWHRNPKIAEAMVDPSVKIEGVIDSGKVLTFTTDEAIKHGFCEGAAENIMEVLAKAGVDKYEIVKHQVTSLDKVIHFLMNPVLQGLLIMIIIGGLYFELQTPGVGFALGASIVAAILYFAPLYLEGLVDNWEIFVFIAGVLLLGLEIFVVPGFGIAGISGIICIIIGLTMAMVENFVFELEPGIALNSISRALLIVVGSLFASLFLGLFAGKQLTALPALKIALNTVEDNNEGYVGVDVNYKKMIGKNGVAYTVLRPTGKVMIDDELYDAIAEIGYIDKNTKILVTRNEATQLYVIKNED